jgi:hypothetical protein
MGAYSSCKALVIGVGRYADPQYDLSYARSDAEALAELLGNEFGFDKIWTLYDSDASRQSIIRCFEQDLQQTDEDDGLLIFFAGHGITVTSAIGDDRGFLVPHDGNPKQPYANLSLTTIRDDYLPMIPAKHVLLIVDACYGGLALRDVATIERPKTIDDSVLAELTRRDRKVRQVLAAGTKDQRVLDGGLFGHSVFTGRLIEALREANPYITADHVGVHVRERVARDSADRRHHQTPQFGYLGTGDGSFVFHRKTPGIVAPSASPHVRLPAGPQPDGEYLRIVLAPYALTEKDAWRLIDKWSFSEPGALSPLGQFAEMEGVANLWSLAVEMQVLLEERGLDHDTESCPSDTNITVVPFKEDIWSIPFRAPESFAKKQYSYRVPVADAVRGCGECKGTGTFICPSCRGTKQVLCPHCDGTGRYKYTVYDSPPTGSFSKDKKCIYCDGDKMLPCTKCKGADPSPCDVCLGTGRTATYPMVRVDFQVCQEKWLIGESETGHDVSELQEVAVGHVVAENGDIPSLPGYLPTSIRRKTEANVNKFLHNVGGRIRRVALTFAVVPYTQCSLRYNGRPFILYVSGVKKDVIREGWVPYNRRRAFGFWVGIPLMILCGLGIPIADGTTGTIGVLGCVAALAVSASYFLWALLSKPKPTNGGRFDAV